MIAPGIVFAGRFSRLQTGHGPAAPLDMGPHHGRQLERAVIRPYRRHLAPTSAFVVTEDIENARNHPDEDEHRSSDAALKVGKLAHESRTTPARCVTVTRSIRMTLAGNPHPRMPVIGSHSMASRGDGSTTNTLTLEMSGVMSRLMGPILASTLRKALATENAGFKQHAEQ